MCICSLLTPISESLLPHKTFVSILMHSRETVTTTNTARMALKLLPQSKVHLRGRKDYPLKPEEILMTSHHPLYLYPTEESLELNPSFLATLDKPIQLIVPDGSWRQTRKFAKREDWLKSMTHVKLPDASKTLFFLRRRVKTNGISTFEAIARALGLIETTQVQTHMEEIFQTMVDRTLQTRGRSLEQYL